MLAVCCCTMAALPATAKVCFVGDPNCAGGSEFGEYEDPNKDNELCKHEGYVWDTEEQGKCANVGGVCPYDARYVKCCGAEYAYQTCVYPLETVKNEAGKVDKCGNLYKCRCNKDYKTPDEWSAQTSENCQPGGGICIMSTSDEVRYDKCTCDTNYYPYEANVGCPTNAIILKSCKDSDGKTYYRCQCPSNFHTCTYGGATGAQTCVENGETKYSSCKEAGAECENQGYFKDCYNQTCYYDTNSTIKDKGTYPTKCEDSYEACEYAYGYYKCRWSAANYCAAKNPEMTNYSKEIPTTCTKDGIQGTVVPCYLNGYSDEEHYLGYYQCKLTCEQQVRGAFSQGYLTVNNNIVDDKGNYGFVRSDSSGKHLYLISDITVPKVKTESGEFGWEHENMAKESYVSVNGINALYDIDSTRYSSCAEKRSSYYYPTIRISNDNTHSSTRMLDVDLNDINIAFKFTDQDCGDDDGKRLYCPSDTSVNERFYIKSSRTWKNVRISENIPSRVNTTNGNAGESRGFYYPAKRNLVIVEGDGVTLTMTGNIKFDFNSRVYTKRYDGYDGEQQAAFTWTHMYFTGKSTAYFVDAKISGSDSVDWDGVDSATMLFRNSSGTMGLVWSRWHVGLLNSKITMRGLRVEGWWPDNAKRSFGGLWSPINDNMRNTSGIFLGNKSTLTVTGYWTSLTGVYSKLYICPGCTFKTIWPFYLEGDDEVICIPNDSTSKFIACDGTSSKCYTNRENAYSTHRDSGFSRYFLYRGTNGGNTCFPSYGSKYQKKCDANTVKNNYYKGSSGSDNWTTQGTNSYGWRMSGCGYPEKYGLGYSF